MSDDPFVQFKAMQREGWALFSPLAVFTTPPAARLVEYAGVQEGQMVLDLACGTGVVAVTAARRGARVQGLDLSPVLLAHARESAAQAGVVIEFSEGDAEDLPYPDDSFDVVLSQFGHMFAPRPALALQEMLRVLKPGGTIAFSTWPPELFTGRLFALAGKYAPPLPPDITPPGQWGDPGVVRERLGGAVHNVTFTRDTMLVPALSVPHYCLFMERNLGPLARLLQGLDGSDPQKSAALRRELEELVTPYFENNLVRQDYLLTRAVKI